MLIKDIIIETASAGSTGAGSIAAVNIPLGGMQKRPDPSIYSKSKVKKKKKSKTTVVVGLSGGVDSSVTAHLLKEEGYNVIGLFMRNWVDESVTIHDECPWVEDSNDAMLVADKLGIPFQVIDMSAAYQERIVDYMFSEYERGRTPNPDVLCNREIKFDLFLKTAVSIGADYVATGHYVRKSTTNGNGKDVHHLLSGLDSNKDQSVRNSNRKG